MPYVIDRGRHGVVVLVLRVLVRVLTVWVEDDLADPRLRNPSQAEDRLENDLRRVRLARTRHAKESCLLTKKIRRRDRDRHIADLLERAVRGRVANVADVHQVLISIGGITRRFSVVDDLGKHGAARFENFQPAVRVVVAEIGTEPQLVAGSVVSPCVGHVEGTEHAASNTGVAEEIVGRRVHDVLVVPRLVELAARLLCVLHAHAHRFLFVREIRVVEHSKEDDRCVLRAWIE
jgi:hypothetical protein